MEGSPGLLWGGGEVLLFCIPVVLEKSLPGASWGLLQRTMSAFETPSATASSMMSGVPEL